MEVILLERIQNLGDLGDQVDVKAGYARNFLIPQQKALLATGDAKARVEERRKELAVLEAKRVDGAKARAALAITQLTIARKVTDDEEGKLYGSASPTDIADALEALGSDIQRSEIQMPEGPIKTLGEFEIRVQLHPEVDYTLSVSVVPEET